MTQKPAWGNLGDGEREEIYFRVVEGGEELEAVAEELGMKGVTLERRLREYRRQRPTIQPLKPGNFNKHWKLLCKMIGRDPKQPVPSRRRKKAKRRRKVIVICDLHGRPYWPLIHRVAEEQPNLIHYDGDLFDSHAFSPFPTDEVIPITDEIARVRAVIEFFSERGIEQWLTEGNHDQRAFKYFANRVDAEFMPLVQYRLLELAAAKIGGARVITNRYNYQLVGGAVVEGALENTWIAHIGDVISGHALLVRKGDGRTVEAFSQWIDQWRGPLGWGESPAVIIQAHVHGASVSYANGGHQIRVEGGYSGEISVIQYAQDRPGARPPVVGFTVFEQDFVDGNWRTDRQSVHFIPC